MEQVCVGSFAHQFYVLLEKPFFSLKGKEFFSTGQKKVKYNVFIFLQKA